MMYLRKHLIVLFLAALALVLLSGCGKDASPAETAAPAPTEASSPSPEPISAASF